MGITKNAKKVKVLFEEQTSFYSTYTCPSCNVTFVGGIRKNVTRFICKCGQELRVE